MVQTKRIQEKSISNPEIFHTIWQSLTHNQQRFAVAMLECKSKKDAALAIKIEPDTVYHWNGDVDVAIAYMRKEAVNAAQAIITASLVKAAAIKRAGLDSNDEKMRQNVSSELLDRGLGKAKQAFEHTGKDGGPIKQEIKLDVTEIRSSLASKFDAIVRSTEN